MSIAEMHAQAIARLGSTNATWHGAVQWKAVPGGECVVDNRGAGGILQQLSAFGGSLETIVSRMDMPTKGGSLEFLVAVGARDFLPLALPMREAFTRQPPLVSWGRELQA